MKSRLPILLTLVPLVAALSLYGWFWRGWAADFRVALAPWLPGTTVEITGFPYRLEANVTAPRLTGGDVVKLSATARRVQVNRGPWRPELTLVSAEAPEFAAVVGPVLSARLTAATSITSIHLDDDGHLGRLSTVANAARVMTGLLPVAATAAEFQVHLRERLGETAPPSSPTGPPRGQMVLSARALRFGAGAPLELEANLVATGPDRLTAYDRWASSGTVEIDSLTLSDATGEVLRLKATVVPIGRTGARLAGTITTVCPASVAAAIAGAPAPSEQRLRAPVVLAFQGVAGAVTVSGVPTDLAARAVRGQQPACPRLR